MTSTNTKEIVPSVLKERGQHGIKEKIKLWRFDTEVNLAESEKGSFFNQKEWLEKYEYRKGMFYSEYGDDLWTSASIFLNKFAVLVKYFWCQ